MPNDVIFIKLRELKNTMTPVEQSIARYILENKEIVPQLSVKALALNSHTSDASVMRFCKTLGYHGYRDFIVSIYCLSVGTTSPFCKSIFCNSSAVVFSIFFPLTDPS